MGFKGDVSSMALDEVFGFLAGNALEGELLVASGEDAALRLYFRDARIFFPFAARRGTYELGRILRHTGTLSREGLASYLEGMRDKEQDLRSRGDDSEELRVARRLQYTEEIHDLFLWGSARFVFKPGAWPARVEADREAGRGLSIDVSSFLMEVARRADERRRIRQLISSSRLLLATRPGAEQEVVRQLAARGVEVTQTPFDGTLELDELLARWGIPHHDALAQVALLVETGHLFPVPPEETQRRIRAHIEGADLGPAARLLGHWIELGERASERLAPDLEQEYVASAAFADGPDAVTHLRLAGPRLFALLRRLIALGTPFAAVLHHKGQEKRISGLPGAIALRRGPGGESATPPLRVYLARQGAIGPGDPQAGGEGDAPQRDASPDGSQAASAADGLRVAAERDGSPAADRDDPVEGARPDLLQRARLEQIADELAEVGLWARVDVTLRNRHRQLDDDERTLSAALGGDDRERLQRWLGGWAEVFEAVPGEGCLFVPGRRAASRDPAARFFRRFELTGNVGEMRLRAQAGPLEFARFVFQGLRRSYLRPPGRAELLEALAAADAQGNDVQGYRLAVAGMALGLHDAFAQRLARCRQEETALPEAAPALEGDLDGVGLAAVIQALRSHRRTGTLVVRAERREERLYFARGDAFVLSIRDAEADAFVAFFLGDEGTEHVSELGSGLPDRGPVDESELDEAEMRALKEQFLELLFWEGSTFAFYQNSLPDEFFRAGDGVSKVALHTDRFLMESMRLMGEWEGFCEQIRGKAAVYRFKDPGAKLAAIRERGHPEILTLVDGQKTIDDLVRISGARRIEVGRLVAELVGEGLLEREEGRGGGSGRGGQQGT